MTGVLVVQGRELSAGDIGLIQGLLAEHPEWGRTRLSEELCRLWDWRNTQGRTKDMAARTLLLRLERGGHIRLPERRRPSSNINLVNLGTPYWFSVNLFFWIQCLSRPQKLDSFALFVNQQV